MRQRVPSSTPNDAVLFIRELPPSPNKPKPRTKAKPRPNGCIDIPLYSVLYLVIATLVLWYFKPSHIAPPELIQHPNDVFVAANLYNNEEILGFFLPELIKFASSTKARGAQVFISLYENGSVDKTKLMLEAYRNDLDVAGISHRIVISNETTWRSREADHLHALTSTNRIEYMAALRNRLLEPLEEFDGNNTQILFLNDVLISSEDMTRLIETEEYDYDAVCAFDFSGGTLYDTWVTRDAHGEILSSFYPYVKDGAARDHLDQGLPFNVYSCWNGAVAFPASLFTQNKIRFRSWTENESRSPNPVSTGSVGKYGLKACRASECILIFKDLWMLGKSKIMINPAIRVMYSYRDAYYLWYVQPILDLWMGFINDLPRNDSPVSGAPSNIVCGAREVLRVSMTRVVFCVIGWIMFLGVFIRPSKPKKRRM